MDWLACIYIAGVLIYATNTQCEWWEALIWPYAAVVRLHAAQRAGKEE